MNISKLQNVQIIYYMGRGIKFIERENTPRYFVLCDYKFIQEGRPRAGPYRHTVNEVWVAESEINADHRLFCQTSTDSV